MRTSSSSPSWRIWPFKTPGAVPSWTSYARRNHLTYQYLGASPEPKSEVQTRRTGPGGCHPLLGSCPTWCPWWEVGRGKTSRETGLEAACYLMERMQKKNRCGAKRTSLASSATGSNTPFSGSHQPRCPGGSNSRRHQPSHLEDSFGPRYTMIGIMRYTGYVRARFN